jgi:hypothetical protein
MYWNLDWSAGASLGSNFVNGAMILAPAAILEGMRHCRSVPLVLAGMLALVVVIYSNANTAFKALAVGGEAESEAKQGKIDTASQLDSQARTLLARRQVQVELAGEKAVGTLEADLKLVIAADPKQWRISSQREDPNGPITGEFCTKVAAAKGKIEAAKARDKIDAELAKIRAERKKVGTVTTPDAYSENVAALLGVMLGREMTAAHKRVIRAHYEVIRAIGLELVAAVMPAFHLLLVDMLQGAAGVAAGAIAAARARRRPTAKPDRPSTIVEGPAPTDAADDLDRCIADTFEDASAGAMTSKEIRPLVQDWYARHNAGKVPEKALWAKMGERFKHDPNGGRPRYLGLKVRVKGPPRLALVATAQA